MEPLDTEGLRDLTSGIKDGMDGDTVSPFNCVRQPFARTEAGINKAVVLVSRINLSWGLDWAAIPSALTEETLHPAYAPYGEQCSRPDVVIGCVDTRAARATIAKSVSGSSLTGYYMLY
jgi:hypothetical protein